MPELHGFGRRSPRRLPRFRHAAILAAVAIFIGVHARAALAADAAACADCHEGNPDPAAFSESVHGFLDCADCHSGAEEFPHAEGVRDADCSACHEEVVEEYLASDHGRLRIDGDDEAPACATCHGGDIHVLVPHTDPASTVHPARIAETCGTCHADPEFTSRHGIAVATPLQAYEASVHARKLLDGESGATCSDCHGSHALFHASDPRSMVNHQRVPETCGACHGEIAAAYEASVHGTAAADGMREAPVCTDCHGEHRILSPMDKSSPVYATNIPKLTCGRCHGDLRLSEKYSIENVQVETYAGSFHGLASRAGSVTVANCSSCHGVHDILPSSNPASHTHKERLAETCGTCHPGAGSRYAIGTVHALPHQGEHVAVTWARSIYVWLIWISIGGMLVHNGLDLYRKARSPLPRPTRVPARTRVRMTLGFRIAHWALIASFLTLVYTGFALKYPESAWAAPLLQWEDSSVFRGWIHRGAAILMLVALAIHAVHLAVDRRARACIAQMMPTMHDVTEFRERMLWYLGRRPAPPKSPALGYPEKVEYLALMWGIGVMTVTGFAMWFVDPMLRLAPKWVSDLATVIHFYEAILASLAILVWHFYFVIFDPVVYPMDTTWLTGREAPGRAVEREEKGPSDAD